MDRELKRGSDEYICNKIDSTISELVYDKKKIRKLYNYYNGILDRDQFMHIEENYGVGLPSSLNFIPLVKKHIDVLVGEFLEKPLDCRITCKDKETISKIFEEKHLAVIKGTKDFIIKLLDSNINQMFFDAYGENSTLTKDSLDNLKKEIESNYISDYEIAAQDLIEHIYKSNDINYISKMSKVYKDLLICGTGYYKTELISDEKNINVIDLNPEDTFIENIGRGVMLNEYSPRCVCRFKMTADQIVNKYYKYLSKEDIKDILEYGKTQFTEGNSYNVRRASDDVIYGDSDSYYDSVLGGFEISPTPGYNTNINYNLIDIYEVEYIEVDNEGVENRYSGVKIPSINNIYIIHPINKGVVRSKNDPKRCKISVNGIFMTTRNGSPFSLIESTIPLQDSYNILHFYADNLVAGAGVKGDFIDVGQMPDFLGNEPLDRVMQYLGYKKQGAAIIDSTQKEDGSSQLNTIYNGYDDTLPVHAAQAIDYMIERIEKTVSSITGVSREKLAMIQQRDAVSNVKVGVTQSTVITKQISFNIDLIVKHSLLDLLNLAKIAFDKGFYGMVVLGDKGNKIITIDKDKYTTTDYDIHIDDSGDVAKNQERIEMYVLEGLKSGQLDFDIAVSTIGEKSTTRLKQRVNKAFKEKTNYVQTIQQLQQQLEETQQQLKELDSQSQQLNSENSKLKNSQQSQPDNSESVNIEMYKAKTDAEFKKNKIELERERLDIEKQQLYDNNPYNNEIKRG